MTLTRLLLTVCALAFVAGCETTFDPLKTLGGGLGKVTGGALAKAGKAPKAKVVVRPRGGTFCGALNALGGPPPLTKDDTLSAPMANWTVGVAEHGERSCGWKAPG